MATDDRKRDAPCYAIHCGGGNDIPVEVRLAGAKTCKGGSCPGCHCRSNFHAIWGALIRATTWSWGTYVDRLETGWLASQEAQAADGGTPAAWAEETHKVARFVWDQLPERHVIDDAYYAKVLPALDRQLGLTGLRLAHLLNAAYGDGQCVVRWSCQTASA